MEPIPSNFYKELNTIRLFLYLEQEPFTNKYNRILLNREQYKKLSLFLANEIQFHDPEHKCENPKCEGKTLEVDDEVVVLPDRQDVVELKNDGSV